MQRIMVIANNLNQASFRLRVAALSDLLAQRGFRLEVCLRPRRWLARRKLLRSAGQFDQVLLQRKLLDPSDARLLARHARRILYDVDDAVMFHNRPAGPWLRWRTRRRFFATAAVLDHVVAGNEYLADQFRRRGCGVTVLPTMVDVDHYSVRQHTATSAPRLVWIGSRSTLPYLREFGPALAEAARQTPGLRLLIVADQNWVDAPTPPTPPIPPIPVEFLPWSVDAEAEALCRGDIGIAPTPTDPWTLGKCGFKIVQYMAAGLPVIASPVGANRDLVRPGQTGFLPATMQDWPAAIATLAADVELRRRMGGLARQIVEREYCLTRAADEWARLFSTSGNP